MAKKKDEFPLMNKAIDVLFALPAVGCGIVALSVLLGVAFKLFIFVSGL